MPEVKNCLTCRWAKIAGMNTFFCLSPDHPVKNDMVCAIAGKLIHDFNGSDWLELENCPAHHPKDASRPMEE